MENELRLNGKLSDEISRIVLAEQNLGRFTMQLLWWLKDDEYWIYLKANEEHMSDELVLELIDFEDAKKAFDFAKAIYAIPERFEWTWEYPEDEYPRLFTAHGACRIIEVTNHAGEKHLAFFGSYMESDRLGKYHLELNPKEEDELLEFLIARKAERAKKELGI